MQKEREEGREEEKKERKRGGGREVWKIIQQGWATAGFLAMASWVSPTFPCWPGTERDYLLKMICDPARITHLYNLCNHRESRFIQYNWNTGYVG